MAAVDDLIAQSDDTALHTRLKQVLAVGSNDELDRIFAAEGKVT